MVKEPVWNYNYIFNKPYDDNMMYREIKRSPDMKVNEKQCVQECQEIAKSVGAGNMSSRVNTLCCELNF